MKLLRGSIMSSLLSRTATSHVLKREGLGRVDRREEEEEEAEEGGNKKGTRGKWGVTDLKCQRRHIRLIKCRALLTRASMKTDENIGKSAHRSSRVN